MDENQDNKKIVEDNMENNEKQIVIQSKRNLTEKENKELANAIENKENEKVKALINVMNNIDEIIDDFGDSAIFLAARKNNIEIVNYLIELGTNVNQQNKYGETPLFNASLEIMKLLVEIGVNINHIDKNGETALSNVCLNGLLEKVKYLISVGVDVNYRNRYSLYKAVFAVNNRFEICKILIEAGIIVNYINKSDGYTPLHEACNKNNLEIIELLLNNGADENIKDKYGRIPIKYVENEEIKEFMRNYNSTKFVLK